MESEGNKELFVMAQSRRTWSVAAVSLRLAIFGWVPGPFWAKKSCFVAQNAQFWEDTSRFGAPAPGRHR